MITTSFKNLVLHNPCSHATIYKMFGRCVCLYTFTQHLDVKYPFHTPFVPIHLFLSPPLFFFFCFKLDNHLSVSCIEHLFFHTISITTAKTRLGDLLKTAAHIIKVVKHTFFNCIDMEAKNHDNLAKTT